MGKARGRAWAAVAAAAVLAWSGGSVADDAPPWTIGELQVTGHRTGPVWWRIQKGDSEVWVLAALPYMPRLLNWSTGRVDRILNGAQILITRGRWNSESLAPTPAPGGAQLSRTIPPDLYARLTAAAALTHQPLARYDRMTPVIAGYWLMRDYLKAADLSNLDPDATLEKLADEHAVPVYSPGTFPGEGLARDLGQLTPEQAQSCLADFITYVEALHAHSDAEAAAWARGNLKGVAENYATPGQDKCFQSSASWREISGRTVDNTVAAINTALSKPGKSVAIFQIGSLLHEHGAIERLRAEEGVTVTTPGD
jgi:hypothetical protein